MGLGSTVGRGLATWVLVLGGTRLVIAQPERCETPTVASLDAAAARTVDWFVTNQNRDGTWLYRYDGPAGEDLGDYNIVRHAGVTWSLEQAATAGFDAAAEAAAAGTAWSLLHVRTGARSDGEPFSALADETGRRIPVGASALWVSALVERRERTGDAHYDDLLVELGRFLAGQVTTKGAVSASYDTQSQSPVAGDFSPYFTGEVLWALARLHRTFPEEGFAEPAERITHYLGTERDDAEGYWPDLPDHWAAYGLAEIARWPERGTGRPLSEIEVAFARRQAQIQSMQIRYETQRREGWLTHVTRGRPASASGAGTLGEAMAGWWRTAGLDDRLSGERAAMAERAVCMAAVLVERQIDDQEAKGYTEPDRVRGAWFQFGITQMDNQQHSLSAILAARAIVAEEST